MVLWFYTTVENIPEFDMSKEAIHFDPAFSQKRWVAYFDLLGTKNLTQTRHIVEVFTVYAHAIERASRELHSRNVVCHTWFSDTFLMFSGNDSISDFTYLEQAARIFAVELLHRNIPLRGAISCGEFYSDSNRNIYFGEALIEAYKYGEIQDWIGFVLCPSAVSRLSSLGFPATERRNYAFTDIPLKSKVKDQIDPYLPACVLGDWFKIDGCNPCIDILRDMKSAITDESILRKYDRTIQFLEAHHRISMDNQE